MSLLMLLEKIKSGTALNQAEWELLESIELHLRCLVDVIGLYVECGKQPDDQMRRILSRLEGQIYGDIQETEGGAYRGLNDTPNQGSGWGKV